MCVTPRGHEPFIRLMVRVSAYQQSSIRPVVGDSTCRQVLHIEAELQQNNDKWNFTYLPLRHTQAVVARRLEG